MIKIGYRTIGDVWVLDCSGKFALGEGSMAIRYAIRDLLKDGRRKILVNLGDVKSIDRNCIEQLRLSEKAVKECGGSLKLLNATRRLKDQHAITQLATGFDCHSSENAAICSF